MIVGFARGPESTLVHVRDLRDLSVYYVARVVERRRDRGTRIRVKLDDLIWWQRHNAYWRSWKSQVASGKPVDLCCPTEDVIIPRIVP